MRKHKNVEEIIQMLIDACKNDGHEPDTIYLTEDHYLELGCRLEVFEQGHIYKSSHKEGRFSHFQEEGYYFLDDVELSSIEDLYYLGLPVKRCYDRLSYLTFKKPSK